MGGRDWALRLRVMKDVGGRLVLTLEGKHHLVGGVRGP